jgi:hexulose-6-phosphate isomerase
MSITSEIGIMQGRLSPKIEGKIQAFPKNTWKNEFKLAKEIGFSSIEWIIEKPLDTNPLFNSDGIELIKKTIQETNVIIEFICADIFIQEPILDDGKGIEIFKKILRQIISSANQIGAKYIEIPFVDNSSIRNTNYNFIIDLFNSFEKDLKEKDIFLNLETDLDHLEFKYLLDELNLRIGANYDIGNSASLGYDFNNEIYSYGERINNIHIKDRVLGGSTVEFGQGNANIKEVLNLLSKFNYDKGIVIQGARGLDDFQTAKSQYEYSKNIINELNYE